LEVTVTIFVNEQVPGHKVIVRPAAPANTSQRHASCECGWESRIGSIEQVMPEMRTHLDEASQLPSGQWDSRPSLAPESFGPDARITWTPGGWRSTPALVVPTM
jgi:hypothetical protein